ncbi:MAG: 3-deoxy-D-manno-octulosonic acid transferase [Bacteroidota bacterium]
MAAQLYQIAIQLYITGIKLAALLGHAKARKWLRGRRDVFQKLHPAKEKTAWFHCASLGEFEQGRPVIEKFRQRHPDYRILLTFFSPSGYEIRKNYAGADVIAYLPADTRKNAKKFIRKVQPDVAFFVKYEFWFNYMKVLKDNHIPLYLISGIFRKNQVFFKWYGTWFRKQLKAFTAFYVQDKTSEQLINRIISGKAVLSGDTRFDRVHEISRKIKPNHQIAAFRSGHLVFLAGSTWPADEKVILPCLLQRISSKEKIKLIIAPHEVHEKRILDLMKALPDNAVRLSEAGEELSLSQKQVLVIDSIGVLSQLYQYADIAYIGGGFGAGIHNTLEAAVFGIPVVFGPNYHKFTEARALIDKKAAFSIASKEDFEAVSKKLLDDKTQRQSAGKNAARYVLAETGATDIILSSIE